MEAVLLLNTGSYSQPIREPTFNVIKQLLTSTIYEIIKREKSKTTRLSN